jgi:hypothetical protein
LTVKRTSYLKRATRRFLNGTRFRAPVEAVTAGVRSLEAWAAMLGEEREAELEGRRGRPPKRAGSEPTGP